MGQIHSKDITIGYTIVEKVMQFELVENPGRYRLILMYTRHGFLHSSGGSGAPISLIHRLKGRILDRFLAARVSSATRGYLGKFVVDHPHWFVGFICQIYTRLKILSKHESDSESATKMETSRQQKLCVQYRPSHGMINLCYSHLDQHF